jgi:hypothetical protein
MQHLLCRASWDADAVRDDVRDYVVEQLYDDQAVLVADETGDLKKGTHTVGVQRQYTGTAGRIENAQVAVYLVYAGPRGHAAVDRELYIPCSWTCDPDRCRAAGLGEDTAFATKPELATRMIGRFLDAGHRVDWVAADEVYGGNPKLRTALEEHGVGYVLAIACSAEVATGAGKFRADALAARVPKRAWQKLSAGAGAKGHRAGCDSGGDGTGDTTLRGEQRVTAAVSPAEAGVAQGSGGEADVFVLAPLRAEVDDLVHPGVIQRLVVARCHTAAIGSQRRTFIVHNSAAHWRGRSTCDWLRGWISTRVPRPSSLRRAVR